VPESADVVEAELAEAGVEVPAPTHELEPEPEPAPVEVPAPAPSRADVGRPDQAEESADRISRRSRKAEEREKRARAKESSAARAPREAAPERKRGAVLGFFISCWAELKKVNGPTARPWSRPPR